MLYFILFLLFFASVPFLFRQQVTKDQSDYALKEEFLHYWQNSYTFQTFMEKNGWHIETHYKQVKESIIAAKRNGKIQRELQKAREAKIKLQERIQEIELFKYSNVDLLLEGFGGKDVVTKNDFINNLKCRYAQYDECLNTLNNFKQNGLINNFQGVLDFYEITVKNLVHPYKKDSFGKSLQISFNDYRDLPQKSSWRT